MCMSRRLLQGALAVQMSVIHIVDLKSTGGKSKQIQPASKRSFITTTAHGRFHMLTATQTYANYCFQCLAMPHLQMHLQA